MLLLDAPEYKVSFDATNLADAFNTLRDNADAIVDVIFAKEALRKNMPETSKLLGRPFGHLFEKLGQVRDDIERAARRHNTRLDAIDRSKERAAHRERRHDRAARRVMKEIDGERLRRAAHLPRAGDHTTQRRLAVPEQRLSRPAGRGTRSR